MPTISGCILCFSIAGFAFHFHFRRSVSFFFVSETGILVTALFFSAFARRLFHFPAFHQDLKLITSGFSAPFQELLPLILFISFAEVRFSAKLPRGSNIIQFIALVLLLLQLHVCIAAMIYNSYSFIINYAFASIILYFYKLVLALVLFNSATCYSIFDFAVAVLNPIPPGGDAGQASAIAFLIIYLPFIS